MAAAQPSAMSAAITLSLGQAESLAAAALIANRSSAHNAASTARALVAAEADGQAGHGLARVPFYAAQARVGKVDGFAVPRVQTPAASALRIDAAHGFSYPAIDLAIEHLVPCARRAVVAVAAIHRSHHFGQAGAHAERLADAGLVALILGNTPKAMAFAGGATPRLGTNPLALAAPLEGRPPLVIDLALSVTARAKIVAARAEGSRIPLGWALDAQGRPTTDPAAALAGTLLPIGGVKGAALALLVEIMTAALTGSAFGWEASSMFDDAGGPPNVGQTILAIEPQALSGGTFAARMSTLLFAAAEDTGVRLPGENRWHKRDRAAREGLSLSPALHAQLVALAAGQG